MDMEQIFVNVHLRIVRTVTAIMPRRTRLLYELCSLILAIVLFVTIIKFHSQHVRNSSDAVATQPSCFPNLKQTMMDRNADIIEICIPFEQDAWWAQWWTPPPPPPSSSPSPSSASSAPGSLSSASFASSDFTNDRCRGNFEFSLERAYFMLSRTTQRRLNITRFSVTVAPNNLCFGTPTLQWLAADIVGYDTIMMNQLLRSFGDGHLVNMATRELYSLHLSSSPLLSTSADPQGPMAHLDIARPAPGEPLSPFQRNVQTWIFIGELFLRVSFLLFAITALVSFTLRQAQIRMLQFHAQVRQYLRSNLPVGRLIILHLMESVGFVPVAVGVLFFLFEFLNDQLLASSVLLSAWVCEMYTVVSVRTRISMRFFPKLFGSYLFLFGVYFFAFPYGFHYLSLFTCAAFLNHAMFFFWNHFEVAAVESSQISLQQPRQSHPTLPALQNVPLPLAIASLPQQARQRLSALLNPAVGNPPVGDNEPAIMAPIDDRHAGAAAAAGGGGDADQHDDMAAMDHMDMYGGALVRHGHGINGHNGMAMPNGGVYRRVAPRRQQRGAWMPGDDDEPDSPVIPADPVDVPPVPGPLVPPLPLQF